MKSPKIALSDIKFDKQEEKAVLSVLRSGWISTGKECERLEKKFADYVGASHALTVTNGTAALHLAFTALGIGPGDEVIIPSLTFVATANAVRYTGAKPVFADISSLDNWTISVEGVRDRITSRTKAIGVVHYAGYPCDMKAIRKIAKEYKLYIVEDAAHGPGSYYDGKHIGTFGDAGCFSFFANKNMTTGEGGMVVTDNKNLARKIRYLRSHGMSNLSWDRYKGRMHFYDVLMLGYNYRFDEIRASLGKVQLAKLAKNNKKRTQLYKHYIKLLKTVQEITIPFSHCPEIVSHHIFPVLLADGINRNKLMKNLTLKGIQTSVHYPPVHRMQIYREYCKDELPLTQIVGEHELTLPLHPGMTFKDVERVVRTFKKYLRKDK